MTEPLRPPFNEAEEKLKLKREEAIRMQRAWSVVAEIFENGTSEEFDPMIRTFREAEGRWSSQDWEGRNTSVRVEQEMNRAKIPLIMAFGEEGTKIVLDAGMQSLILRNQLNDASNQR